MKNRLVVQEMPGQTTLIDLMIRGHCLPNKYRVDIVVEIIRAVSSLHQVGINVNIINPERVYIDTRNGKVKVKFYDFTRATCTI